ncbi:MAG: fimbrillin family protein [Bacteroidales bacterium]|nr:fimbrillin family protein [Bacteroidales bacterium]
MKKYFIIAAAAVVAMAACSKNEIVDNGPGEKISFQVANYVPQTKATALEDEFTSFKCKAYLHAEGYNLDGSYNTSESLGFQNFFGTSTTYTETVSYTFTDANSNETKDAGEVTWKTAQDYYWPKSSHSFVNFVGWVGNTGTDPTVGYAWDATASAYKATIAWPFTSTLGTATQNLLYADMAWRFHSNNSPATNASVSHVSEGVPMLFHHLLSKFCVKAYAVEKTVGTDPEISTGTGTVTDGTATWTITFEDLTLGSINTAATINLSNTDPGSSRSNYPQAWTQGDLTATTAGSLGPVAGANAVSAVTSENANVLIAETCVIPQTIGSGVKLSGKVNIHTAYTNGASNNEKIPFEFTLNAMGTSAWAQNTIYTYILKVNPAQKLIYFDPAVDAPYTGVTGTEQAI